ncbi:MAG: DUF3347 domain-containing protein [Ginsengibacter sp.]
MKSLIIGFTIVANALMACSNSNDNTTDAKQMDVLKDTVKTTYQQAATDTAKFSSKEIIANYLQLKNALTKDNGKDAAAAGNAIVAILSKIDKTSLSADQQKVYADLQDDIKENAEHIGENANKIDHQREHFEMLSKDMADLVKTFGNGGQTLYKDFCPMANDGKGAIWISETKDIKNPYLGKKMPTCGSVKETIQ